MTPSIYTDRLPICVWTLTKENLIGKTVYGYNTKHSFNQKKKYIDDKKTRLQLTTHSKIQTYFEFL